MKKLEELGIDNAPWDGVTFCHPGMNGYVVSNANLPEGDGRRKIVASDVRTKNAILIAAAPKLYKKAYEIVENLRIHLAVPTQSIEMNRAEVEGMVRDLESVLAEAAGETSGEGNGVSK